jgi:hypothetical protein
MHFCFLLYFKTKEHGTPAVHAAYLTVALLAYYKCRFSIENLENFADHLGPCHGPQFENHFYRNKRLVLVMESDDFCETEILFTGIQCFKWLMQLFAS